MNFNKIKHRIYYNYNFLSLIFKSRSVPQPVLSSATSQAMEKLQESVAIQQSGSGIGGQKLSLLYSWLCVPILCIIHLPPLLPAQR